jgi:hypothetical protein
LFVLLGLGFWLNGMTALAGISIGMALLSGPIVWPGILGLAIAYVLANWLVGQDAKGEQNQPDVAAAPSADGVQTVNQRTALLFALGTLFFIGTLFFSLPSGLSAAASGIPVYVRGWIESANVPALQILQALLLYSFLPLAFGLYSGIRGMLRNERINQFLFAWFFIALLLVLLYPGRQVSDLAWPILPLTALASRQFTRVFRIPAYDRLATLGQAVLVALVLGFTSLTLVALSNNILLSTSQEYIFRLAGAGVLLFAGMGLVAWGWSKQVALRGFSWGAALLLFFYSIAATWNVSGLSGRAGAELWGGAAPTG